MDTVHLHFPDTCHSWGIEFNRDKNHWDESAAAFVKACNHILYDKAIFPKGTWFHQCGCDTAPNYSGYQFFEFWGPQPDETAALAAIMVAEALKTGKTL